MIVIGLTGSFASGKTQAADFFKKHGAKVFDADTAARRALRRGTAAYRAVLKMFGRDFLKRGGDLDRRKLARHVFDRPRDLKKLNILIHPGVIVESLQTIERFRRSEGVLVLDAPLLFEARMENLADYTVVVRASSGKIFGHAKKRGIDRSLAEKILSSQWPIEKKARRADFVIDNDGSPADLEKKVLEILQTIKTKTEGNARNGH
ncbi:MAG: dephospho-CoA kinase [Candidatus Omnitrophica bacterium]|nr:dephospho-CoA kinase [Candidatus Omnitrophota bacterium]